MDVDEQGQKQVHVEDEVLKQEEGREDDEEVKPVSHPVVSRRSTQNIHK